MASGHRLLIFLISFLFAISSALPALTPGSPLVEGTIHQLDRRQCVFNTEKNQWECDFTVPTLDQIRKRMQDTSDQGRATPANTLWFYTGWGDYEQKKYSDVFRECYAYMSRACLPHYAVGNALNQDWQNVQNDWINNHIDKMNVPEPDQEMNKCYYQGLSVSVLSPDVYLFMPPDMKTGEWDAESVWEQLEFWPLTWNPRVKNIWRADPKAAPGHGTQLIWTADAVLAATKNIATGPRKVKDFCRSWPASGMKGGVPASWPTEWGGGGRKLADDDRIELP